MNWRVRAGLWDVGVAGGESRRKRRRAEVGGLPLIHDKTVDEWGTVGSWLLDERATRRLRRLGAEEIAIASGIGLVYCRAMAWSEEQTAQGRAELARRREFENASTYRGKFWKAVCWMIFCILLGVLGVRGLMRDLNWLDRAEDIIFLTAMLLGVGLCGILAHLRFLDWRRAAAREAGSSRA